MDIPEPLHSSERLTYHKLSRVDQSNYISWYMEEAAMKYVTLRALTMEQALSKFESRLKDSKELKFPEHIGTYIVRLKDDCQTFIGLAHLTYDETSKSDGSNASVAEVGYGLMPEFWGKRYATEILASMIQIAKMLGSLKKLSAEAHPDNKVSIKILLNQGFVWSHKSLEEDDEPVEHYILSL